MFLETGSKPLLNIYLSEMGENCKILPVSKKVAYENLQIWKSSSYNFPENEITHLSLCYAVSGFSPNLHCYRTRKNSVVYSLKIVENSSIVFSKIRENCIVTYSNLKKSEASKSSKGEKC